MRDHDGSFKSVLFQEPSNKPFVTDSMLQIRKECLSIKNSIFVCDVKF